ncbi:SDR family oxidoreductase [Carboxylicivirga sp. A043]|uniref:SDR family oxidoreductase n=1 Tax=Carboxylicivirga litoralis TaxID=2816963 RepID=UPI0021CB3556|nr:SDR family oxidoreductase [Carboxylicivirga sp. A043]MCU4157803.1 SDR family oxidoreductase [Carboxylicivirga sp. A043]
MKVLITGAAKRIGNHLVRHFAEIGYDVFIHVNKSIGEGEKLLSELKLSYSKQSFQLIQCNLADYENVEEQFYHAFETYGVPDVIIHNASYYLNKNMDETSVSDITQMMGIHLFSPMLINKAYKERGGKGNIISILDTAIQTNQSTHGMYLLSKKSLADYTKMIAQEWAPFIRVNGIAPGPVLPPEGKDNSYFNKVVDNTPLQRQVDLSSISDTVDFILKNKNMTGQIIYCDSGQHLL